MGLLVLIQVSHFKAYWPPERMSIRFEVLFVKDLICQGIGSYHNSACTGQQHRRTLKRSTSLPWTGLRPAIHCDNEERQVNCSIPDVTWAGGVSEQTNTNKSYFHLGDACVVFHFWYAFSFCNTSGITDSLSVWFPAVEILKQPANIWIYE